MSHDPSLPPDDGKICYSIPDAASACSPLSARALRRAIAEGVLRSVKANKRTLILKSDLVTALASGAIR
jgi:hypothetical protein